MRASSFVLLSWVSVFSKEALSLFSPLPFCRARGRRRREPGGQPCAFQRQSLDFTTLNSVHGVCVSAGGWGGGSLQHLSNLSSCFLPAPRPRRTSRCSLACGFHSLHIHPENFTGSFHCQTLSVTQRILVTCGRAPPPAAPFPASPQDHPAEGGRAAQFAISPSRRSLLAVHKRRMSAFLLDFQGISNCLSHFELHCPFVARFLMLSSVL